MSLVVVGRSVGQKKKRMEGVGVLEKAGLISKKALLQSQLENVVFLFVIRSIDVN